MEIINLLPQHWEAVKNIYLEGIATGQATFQTTAPTWEEWDKGHLATCRSVATEAGKVCGWAALTPVSGRCVYAGVAEVSVYISENFRGKHVGQRLLESLITQSENQNIWTLQAGIFPENVASVKLHEKLGFRIVGLRERIGKMNGVWRNVYLLERRSQVAGLD
jgi:phosphinothricin acetyltransferase